jgi:aldehyde dehydrogenase (NAD+)
MRDLTALRHLVGGEWRNDAATSALLNPSDLTDVVTERIEGGPDVVDTAVQAARAAFRRWGNTLPQQRARVLGAIAARIRAHTARMAAELAREEGKLVADARAEAAKAADVFQYYAGLSQQLAGSFGNRLAVDADVIVTREPHGVVGLITPWNAPLAIVAWKLAPALMTGNAVVLKPSEHAPVCVQTLISLVLEALAEAGAPPGLVNMVHGGGSTGFSLATHPGIDALSFTGGLTTGRRVAEAVAGRLLPLQLELGGKNAFVVAADADIEKAVALCVSGAFFGAGQKCTATSRIIVEDAIANAFTDRMTRAVAALKAGASGAADVHLGPVISAGAVERVARMVDHGMAEGASHLASGKVIATTRGHFSAPVLLRDDNPASALNQDEIFGPVASIIRVADLDAAIAVSNATAFGLSSGIATRSIATARRFQRESVAGIVAVNQTTSGADMHAPFEGTRLSGFGGAEQGTEAPRFFSRGKTTYLAG